MMLARLLDWLIVASAALLVLWAMLLASGVRR